MDRPGRRVALACALLTTTAITTPAVAQVAQPSIRQQFDSNGVDVSDGSYNFALQEGSIGSGPGSITLTRLYGAGGVTDSLTMRFRRNVSGANATISIVFGNRRETFTGPAGSTSFLSDQGNGATLTKTDASHYRYTASDGRQIDYAPPPLTHASNSTFCRNGAETACDLLAVAVVRPDGAALSVLWDTGENCGTPTSCAQFWRQRGVSTNSGYRLRFSFQEETAPASGSPGAGWFTRTGAALFNDAVPGAPVRNVTYGTPSTGVTSIVTDGGAAWTVRTDTNNRVVGITRPGSSAENVTITHNTLFVTSVTEDGVVTSYSTINSPMTGLRTTKITNALNQATWVTITASTGLPVSVKDALNRTTSFQYDGSGRLQRVTAPEGNYTHLTYDARGNVTQTQMVAVPASGLAPITTSATYPATCTNPVTCNRPQSITDARGNVTDFTYDPVHGGVLTATAPAVSIGAAAVRPQERTDYTVVNGVHLPTTVSACQSQANCAGSADEVRTSIQYNANHLPVSVSSGNGSGTLTATRTLTYDTAGDVLTVDGPLSGTADTVRYRYDASRRPIGEVSPDPDGPGPLPPRATRLTYRPDGQLRRSETGIVNSQSDADWAAMIVLEQTAVAYNSSDRPAVVSHAAGGALHSVVQLGYDSVGRVECTALRMNSATWSALPASGCSPSAPGADGPDRINRTVWDAAGQVIQTRVAVGTALEAADRSTTYGLNGQPLTVTDGENNRTSYEYDGHGRLRRTYYPVVSQGANASAAGDYEELDYDAAGNITTRRNRAGEISSFTFDALDRVIVKNLPGSEPDVTYAYDLLSRMVSATQSTHVLSFTYDALGRQLTQTNPGGTVGSTWDLAGRRTRISYPGNYFVDQDYLLTGEMERIRENGATSGAGVIATFSYDLLGRRTALSRGNGTTTSYAYDPASRLSALSLDLNGSGHDLALGFSYNAAGQLISNTRSNAAYSYAAAVGTTDSPANGLNQLASSGSGSPNYDARGNLSSEGGRSFSYSSENLLTGYSAQGRTFTWSYDPLMRVHHQTTTGESPRDYVFDGGNMLVQNSNGSLQERYVYGPGRDEPLYAIDSSGNRTWMHGDERGSVTAYSDASGAAVATIGYDEYGIASGGSGSHGYAGTFFLGLSRLSYNRARIYDPALGRFLQPDPIGYGDGMNMYAYVGGDPVNGTDPSGLCMIWTGNVYDIWDGNTGAYVGQSTGPEFSVFGADCDFARAPFASFQESGGGSGGSGGAPPFITAPAYIACGAVRFTVTGIGPRQANSSQRTAISQEPGNRINPQGGGVAIKPRNFGVADTSGARRGVLGGIILIPLWDRAEGPGYVPAVPPGLPSRGAYVPIDVISPPRVRNAPGNHIDLYRYADKDQAFASTRSVPVIAIIPLNNQGVTCPR